MSKFQERIEARKLRQSGQSIKNIAKHLSVSPGSVSHWCSDVVLSKSQALNLRKKQIESGMVGRQKGAETNKKKKADNIKARSVEAKNIIGNLSDRDRLMLGIGLYWGEGVKSHQSSTAMVNSDPEIIKFAYDWFLQLGVAKERLNPYIYVSEIHKDREQIILNFWSKYLGIPKKQFHSVIFLKGRPKKVYENHDNYYGVLSLRVSRGTDVKYKILGLIKACKMPV